MIRLNIAAISLALVATASTAANAFPHFTGIHRYPAVTSDTRIHLSLYNKAASFRDIKVDGHVYTVMPHQALSIKAPAGTAVISETTANLHRKGDVLFAVSPEMQNRTVTIN